MKYAHLIPPAGHATRQTYPLDGTPLGRGSRPQSQKQDASKGYVINKLESRFFRVDPSILAAFFWRYLLGEAGKY
jgi:hypothetical protein